MQQTVPEKWIKPYRKMELGTAIIIIVGAAIVSAMVLTYADAELMEMALVSITMIGGFALVSAVLGTAVGKWAGGRWGKKQRWQGWAGIVGSLNAIGFVFTFGSQMIGVIDLPIWDSINMVFGGILWVLAFQAYYKTELKHAFYSFLVMIAAAIAVGIILLGGLVSLA
ncbi:MAG: hypothetical protein KAW41_06080 [Candidatus Diapherotrites archaeon]|nr:hypothetical protein [Candidatus Diapherotrites archaeon]